MRPFMAFLGFLFSLPRRLGVFLANLWGRLRARQIPDYIRIDLGEKVVERATPLPFIWRKLAGGPEPQSLEELRRTLLAIAPRPTSQRGCLACGPHRPVPSASTELG